MFALSSDTQLLAELVRWSSNVWRSSLPAPPVSSACTPALSLLRRGDTVVGIDNLNDYYDVRLKHDRLACLAGQADFRFIEMAIADRAAMAALFAREGFERVIHLAAQAGVR